MTQVKIFTIAYPPNEYHLGWVEFHVDDINGRHEYSKLANITENILKTDFLNSLNLSEFKTDGTGIYDYDERYFGLDRIVEIPNEFKNARK